MIGVGGAGTLGIAVAEGIETGSGGIGLTTPPVRVIGGGAGGVTSKVGFISGTTIAEGAGMLGLAGADGVSGIVAGLRGIDGAAIMGEVMDPAVGTTGGDDRGATSSPARLKLVGVAGEVRVIDPCGAASCRTTG